MYRMCTPISVLAARSAPRSLGFLRASVRLDNGHIFFQGTNVHQNVCVLRRPLPRVSPRARADVFVFLQARALF
jgi:hypothetical protein